MNTSPFRTHPARQGSLKPSQLTCYLAGAVGTAALLGAPQVEAAVTAVTFGFGPQLTVADGYDSWATSPFFGTLFGNAQPTSLALGTFTGDVGAVYHTSSYNSYAGTARFFANGTVIGAGGNGNKGYAFFQNDSAASVDFTSDQLNKNIGFLTTTNNWGWANVSWTEATKTLAINSAFVESDPFTPITIPGAVPEPSRALLALAGLSGVALRRRRKQVG